MPKWVMQIIFSVIMLIVMIVALYISGKEAGSLDLLYMFLILVTSIAYIVSIFCVSFDAEVRVGSEYRVLWVSMLCSFVPIIGHLAWLYFRPQEKITFAEYFEEEEAVLEGSMDENA